jgi:hypothetical protein
MALANTLLMETGFSTDKGSPDTPVTTTSAMVLPLVASIKIFYRSSADVYLQYNFLIAHNTYFNGIISFFQSCELVNTIFIGSNAGMQAADKNRSSCNRCIGFFVQDFTG